MAKISKTAEAQGAGLAGFALSAGVLARLKAKKIFPPEDVDAIFDALVGNLGSDDLADDPSAQIARELLSRLADQHRSQSRSSH